MPYVRYINLMKGQAYSKDTNPYSRQTGCYVRIMTTRIQLKENYGREFQVAWRQDELIGGKAPVVV
jgi:hypothetical protein